MQAQTTEAELPGDTTLPSSTEELQALAALETGSFDYAVSDYFKKPEKSDFQFSPNGQYVSYRERDENGKSHVFIKSTETDKVSKVIEEGEELIRGYGWANDDRLLYVSDQGGNENYHIYAIDLDGTNQQDLTPFEDVRAGIINSLPDQKEFMIIQMNKDNPEVFEPYKLNVTNGDLVKLYDNPDPTNPIASYDFDKDGMLRAFTKQKDGINYVLYYKKNRSEEFTELIETTWKDNFYIQGFDYKSTNPDHAYVISNLESDTDEILLVDLGTMKTLKKIYSNDTYDVSGIARSRKRDYEVDYYSYTGEKRVTIPVSNYYKKLHKKFQKQFADKQFSIASKTEAEDKYLIYVTSDKLYGKYFVYDVKNDEFKEVIDMMPQLKENDMAEMRPIKYKTRDGLTVHGYLTIPQGAKKGNKVPLIVNPHGGPYGPRDNWGFNPETQLFASRGYATLQVNYRGSGGYGKEHYLAGSKQIGRKMLNDLEDGVAYVKSMDFIDGDRIAIYGASYGGLATLGSLVKTPDLYTCGVDYVGVSNLFTFVNSFPAYWKPFMAQFYEQWYDETNEEEKKLMEEVSPALHVDKITKPLFVVQGANDPRVNINESDQIVSKLRERNVDVPYMVKYNEGHGFGHEENRIELYQSMMGFFAKHLK